MSEEFKIIDVDYSRQLAATLFLRDIKRFRDKQVKLAGLIKSYYELMSKKSMYQLVNYLDSNIRDEKAEAIYDKIVKLSSTFIFQEDDNKSY